MVNSSARRPGSGTSTASTDRTCGASPAHRSRPAARSTRSAGPNIAWVDSTGPARSSPAVRPETTVTSYPPAASSPNATCNPACPAPTIATRRIPHLRADDERRR